MAVLNAQGIARVSIPLLSRALVLPRTFMQVPADGFTGPNGETITVRVRLPRTARTQASPLASITYDAQNEVGVEVSLAHLYDAIRVSDEDLTLSLEDFASQITEPQVKSVAAGAESQAYTVLNALAADDSFALTASEADTKATVQGAREYLSENLIPADDNRFLAVAPDIVTRMLNVEDFVRADALGDGQSSALRNAVFGKVYGFTVLEAPGLTAGTAVAYHRSGFVWANKMPAEPRGANETSAISEQGINIRQIFDYDPNTLSDRSVLSTFAGCSEVFDDADESTPEDNFRFYKMDTATT